MASLIVLDDKIVLRALRKPGGEVQFTKVIGALAQHDQQFAQGLLKALLHHAPHGDQASDRRQDGARVRCEVERNVYGPDERSRGRIELQLIQGGLRLLVEVKLHSDYSDDQLDGYLETIDASNGQYLMAVTRDVSRYPEPVHDVHEAWIGSVRWAGLRKDLENLPATGPLREHWNLLLEVLEMDGDLGSQRLNEDLINAFERAAQVQQRLDAFLKHVGPRALEVLREQLAPSGTCFAPSRQGRKPSERPDVHWGEEELYLAFQIPAGGEEMLWIGFDLSDEYKARFYIAAGPWSDEPPPDPEAAEWQNAYEVLQGCMGQELTRDVEFGCKAAYPLRGLDQDDVPKAMAAHIKRDLPLIVSSGMFASAMRGAPGDEPRR